MRKAWFLIIVITLLACNLFTPPATSVPLPVETPSNQPPTLTPEVIPAEVPTALLPAMTPEKGYTIVRLHPSQGDLMTLLEQEAQKALELGQKPFVEFDASW